MFFWSLLLVFFSLIAVAADFFNLGRMFLWGALGLFAVSKMVRLLEICFLMKETDTATRIYLAAVNLVSGGAAIWLLVDLVLRHSGM